MINPFTNLEYSEKSKEQRLKIAGYPASDPLVIEELKQKFKNNDVLIVRAATGAGKGVVIATEIMKLLNLNNEEVQSVNKVVITEPRSLNTRTQ